MASKPTEQISFAESVNRSLNLLVATILGITALAFGGEIFLEDELIDKVDNTLIVVIGVVAVAWYFLGRNWAGRSRMPVILASATVVAQIIGIGLEFNDPPALGDDIPGLLVFGSLLIIAAIVYTMNGRYLSAGQKTNS